MMDIELEQEINVDIVEQLPKSYTKNGDDTPLPGIELLRDLGLLAFNVPKKFGGKACGPGHNLGLLRKLKEVGCHDLSLGRIYEGHINALILIDAYGTPVQKSFYFKQAVSGKLFGIWNSELSSEALEFEIHENGFLLKGAKIFCSGAGYVDHPIVTAHGPDGSRMVILHPAEYSLEEDYDYWQPLGMKASVSCRFDFTDIPFDRSQLLGGPWDYVQEPDFTGGAIRFAAVQLGGAEAAIRATVEHLQQWKRTEDPDQVRRMGQLSLLQETGRLWLEGAGRAMDEKHNDAPRYMHYANMFRTVARNICEEVLELCGLSIGLQGMMAPHPFERIYRDLSVYLKQPGPDRALNNAAAYFNETYGTDE